MLAASAPLAPAFFSFVSIEDKSTYTLHCNTIRSCPFLESRALLARNHHIRLLVASRDEVDIRAALQDIHAAEIDLNGESKQKEDLFKYITGVLHSDEPFRTWKVDHPRRLGAGGVP